MPESLIETKAGTPTKVALTRFIRYTARFATTTQRHYKEALYRFEPFLPDFIEQIRAEHIDIFVNSLKTLNSSKNSLLVPVRSFLQWCETYLDVPNVAKKVKSLPEQPPKQRVLSEAEYKAVLAVCEPFERKVVQFLASTGLRASEYCSLTQQNISHDQKCLILTGKGGKRRVVPLNNTARASIDFSKSFNRDSLRYLCNCLSRRASVCRFGPHALRHFFTTRLVRAGVPLVKVSRILGHSSVAITEKVYLHLLPCDFLGATDCLDF